MPEDIFTDRRDAGRRLSRLLEEYRERDDVVVLGLPRGGVPVAAEIAEALNAPLDVYIVRKLGTPQQEELAMGAIAPEGARVLNRRVIRSLGVTDEQIRRVEARERKELERREREYRGDRQHLPLSGRTVILVDDGLATGATMRAAARAVRNAGPKRLVVAIGTAPRDTVDALEADEAIDDVVAAITPAVFFGVGGSYADFSQTTDAEVIECLERTGERKAEERG